MAGLFEYVDRLTAKKPIDEDFDTFDRDYSQFMINRVFSCDKSLVILANTLNGLPVDNQMHFDFMDVVVPKGKRWIKYTAKKAKADKELQYLMEYFECGLQAAKEYRRLISKEEMKQIKDFFEKRGRK